MAGVDRPVVVFLDHAANETGPPISLLAFQRWLRAHAGEQVDFVTIHSAGGNLLERFEALGPTTVLRRPWDPDLVVRAGLERAGRVEQARRLAVAAARERLRFALRRTRPTLVWVEALAPVNIVALRAFRSLHPDVPVVLHVHELSVILEHGLAADDLGYALEVADHLVVVAEAVRRYLHERHGVADDRMTVVHEHIDPPPNPGVLAPAASAVRAELGIAADARLVVACGSTDWRKAPDLFVRAAWELRRRRPDLGVTWAWVGNSRNAYEDHLIEFDLDRLDLRGQVHFVGVRADPVPWFVAADVFVLPSREDPFPLVCLEAGAVGTPLVCFDNGGMPELVEPAGAGTVVAYPDVVALADAVADLLDDDDTRLRAGAAAAQAVRGAHLTEQLAPRLLEVIERHRRR
jgi:glycosyltransferase involved in cell wall biosynthesis